MPRAGLVIVLALATACGGGSTAASSPPSTAAATSAPAATAPAASTRPATTAPLPAFTDGSFSGTWNNTTFGSTGPARFDVKVDTAGARMTITITLGGNVFGAPAPAPESFTLPLGAAGATFSGKSKTFGDVTASVKDGTIAFKGDNVPGGRVKSITGDGKYTPTTIDMTYSVALSDGSTAKGTVTLKKI